MYFERTTNGIEYNYELASSEGAAFTLYPAAEHTRQMIAAAKAEIRRERDVVYMCVASEQDWNDRYRTEIYRHPLIGPLRWYEINADTPSVLKYHRLKGTPVETYITRFILPCKAETK